MTQRWVDSRQRIPVRRAHGPQKIDSHTQQQDLLSEMGTLLSRLSHIRGEWPPEVYNHCVAWAAVMGHELPPEGR